MNANNLFQLVQQGFRITVGATASLVDTIQNPEKREETLTQLKSELTKKTQEWAEKGEVTEQEARKFVDNFFQKQPSQAGANTNVASNQTRTEGTTTTTNNAESELKELTEKIIALRHELEQLQDQN